MIKGILAAAVTSAAASLAPQAARASRKPSPPPQAELVLSKRLRGQLAEEPLMIPGKVAQIPEPPVFIRVLTS